MVHERMDSDLRLRLSNSEQNVEAVRAAVRGFAALLELDALEFDDLDTAVGEACKNVVWHAYEGTEGPLEVELRAREGAIEALVRDRGIGIRPHLGERREHHTGIGLALIHVRTRRVSYTNLPAGGTELRMEFEMPDVRALAHDESAGEADLRPRSQAEPGRGELELECRSGAVADAVLPGLVSALWRSAGHPRADFSELASTLAREAESGPTALSTRVSDESLDLALQRARAGAETRLRQWAATGPAVDSSVPFELDIAPQEDSRELHVRVYARAERST